MTNIQRTINWIDRTVEEAFKDGIPFNACSGGSVFAEIHIGVKWDAQNNEFICYDAKMNPYIPQFRYYTRDKITP